MVKNVEFLLALNFVKGLGPVRLKLLLDYYQDPKLAWEAKVSDLLSLGLPQKVVYNLEETRKKLTPEKYLAYVKSCGISWVTIFDPSYPKLLKEIYDPPIVLFYKGDMGKADRENIAIVGTRKVTGYGKLVTEKFSQELVLAGLTIVSGLASGVDTIAHQVALESKGSTIAVLGGGLNHIFPSENIGLARRIISSGLGAVVSEFSPDELPLAGNFPVRNRIISGLSMAVLVTEAAQNSGSLITAKCALEQGRDVLAVPGPVTSKYSKGPAFLIQQGAKLVTEPAEVLEELGIKKN